VLIVEDEGAVLRLAKRILEGLGYAVLTAATPSEAIRLVTEQAGVIHLLITDVVMPEMNGPELAARLEALRPGLTCLYMSGYAADVIADRNILNEAMHFLEKPFFRETLAAQVSSVLDQA
jgi:two-component system, cell cycle sensor histidine kinase and response regulator CckA